jgi:hypothetical protein
MDVNSFMLMTKMRDEIVDIFQNELTLIPDPSPSKIVLNNVDLFSLTDHFSTKYPDLTKEYIQHMIQYIYTGKTADNSWPVIDSLKDKITQIISDNWPGSYCTFTKNQYNNGIFTIYFSKDNTIRVPAGMKMVPVGGGGGGRANAVFVPCLPCLEHEPLVKKTLNEKESIQQILENDMLLNRLAKDIQSHVQLALTAHCVNKKIPEEKFREALDAILKAMAESICDMV